MRAIIFALLSVCALTCIKRTDAINRSMEWVNNHVPYDASKYTNGYVQGCQGIVGYGWQFPKPGIPAGHLIGSYCTAVTKNDLQMGDIMTNPTAHELLFHSWSDSSKSHYWAIELGGSRGSVKYVIPWPYWDGYNPERYVPCRVNSACVNEQNQEIAQNIQSEEAQ